MSAFKKITKKCEKWVKLHLVPPLAALLLHIIGRTIRWMRNDLDVLKGKEPFIAAFWHGRQLMFAPLYHMGRFPFRLAVLISGHTDGRLIASTIKYFGLESVAGSSSKGGVRALMQLIETLKSGVCVGITPDGPRGPMHQVKDGVIKLAQISGYPIVPIVYGSQSFWQWKSWDAMILPKPFSKGVCLVGEPIFISSELAGEELLNSSTLLQTRLNELTKQADTYSYA